LATALTVLKVGMTTRTVEERFQEINRATGVAIPFGVRRCWRVFDPIKAERLVYETLDEFRVRNDREFFKTPFPVAAKLLDTAKTESGLEIRTLGSLTAPSEA
jgi:Meiotically up-regulated gene 113